MLGPRATSIATLALAVTYPAYLTYKTLEHDRKKLEAQRGWCIYWVVCGFWLSVIPALDRAFDGRVGLYRECKVRARVAARSGTDVESWARRASGLTDAAGDAGAVGVLRVPLASEVPGRAVRVRSVSGAVFTLSRDRGG